MKTNSFKPLLLLMLLLLGFSAATSQIIYRTVDWQLNTMYDVNDLGNGVDGLKTYNYASNSLSNIPSIGAHAFGINNNNDMAGTLNGGTSNGMPITQPAYEVNGVWHPIGFFPGESPFWGGEAVQISENGNYVTGTYTSINHEAFLYNPSTGILEKIADPAYGGSFANCVTNTGIIGGFIYPLGETIYGQTIAAYMTTGAVIHTLPPAEIPLSQIEYSNQNAITAINSSNIMVGNKGCLPMIYDLNSDTTTTFPLPPGYRNGKFTAISDTGVAVGTYLRDTGNRETIVYSPTLCSRPVRFLDLLEANNINTENLDDMNVYAISPNGQFISGNQGLGSFVVNLNNSLFSSCFINSRGNENITADANGIVNYMMPTSVCSGQSDTTLVLTSGLPSGSVFPIGTTTVSYNFVNSMGTVLDSCSFDLTVNCSPMHVPTVSAITAVHDDSSPVFQFSTSADSNVGYEDFTSGAYETFQISAGNFNLPYPIRLKGNTNGNNTDYFTVFIDWNHDGIFDNDFERNDMGTITNSTGTDQVDTVGYLFYPLNAELRSKTRMRVIKNRGAYVTDACSVSSGIGQIEDYTAQFTGGILSNPDFTEQRFKLFPNPASDIFTVESQSIIKEIIIYNLIGQEVLKTKANSLQERIDISDLPINTYLIKIVSEEGSKTLKLMKQ